MHERLVLATWEQQWPRFRSRFCFCTGAIRSREYQGTTLDLQVIPGSALRETRRRFPSSEIIERAETDSATDVEDWVSASARDLCSDGTRELRSFLWQLASDYDDGRAGFRSFVDAFDIIRAPDSVERKVSTLVNIIGERFQSSVEAQRLKTGLFGSYSQRTELRDVSDLTIVRRYSHGITSTAFDADTLFLRSRARELWHEDRQLVADNLFTTFTHPSTHLQAAVVGGVFESLDASEISNLVDRFADFLLPVVASDPRLVRMPELWKCRPETQKRLVSALGEIGSWEVEDAGRNSEGPVERGSK